MGCWVSPVRIIISPTLEPISALLKRRQVEDLLAKEFCWILKQQTRDVSLVDLPNPRFSTSGVHSM